MKYALITKHQRKIGYIMDEMTSELHLLKTRLKAPFCRIRVDRPKIQPETVKELTTLSDWDETESRKGKWAYISPRAQQDRAITCPNAATHGCLDLWAPDLVRANSPEYAHGAVTTFPWSTSGSSKTSSTRFIREFNTEVEAGNPLNF